MVHFRWNFEIFAKKIPQGWLNTLEVFLERLIYYVKKFSKSGRISIQICTPGCSPWQARNIDRLVVISFLRLMRPKGRLCSAVEGTPKGVQMCYASATQSVFWLSCHQLCFRLPSAKDVFFAQLPNAHGEVNSPTASTLFVLDRSDI